MKDCISVANTTTSLPTPLPKSPQPLEPDAVAPLIAVGEKFCNEEVIVLLAVLDGLLSEVCSGDIVALAVYSAQDRCVQLGISNDVFCEAMGKLEEVWKGKMKRNPMAGMF